MGGGIIKGERGGGEIREGRPFTCVKWLIALEAYLVMSQ